jgi:hypothetical protein
MATDFRGPFQSSRLSRAPEAKTDQDQVIEIADFGFRKQGDSRAKQAARQ